MIGPSLHDHAALIEHVGAQVGLRHFVTNRVRESFFTCDPILERDGSPISEGRAHTVHRHVVALIL